MIDGYKYPYKTFSVNTNGVLNILEISKECDFLKSLIIVTSDKCYKIKKLNKLYEESDELGGYDPYSASKAAAEIICLAYKKILLTKGIGLATIRAGNVIGGGDFSKNRVIPDCYRSMKDKKLLIRNPKSIRPWQHVLDVSNGYLLLAKKLYISPKKFSGSWNFGPNNKLINVLNLVKNFKKYSKKNFRIKILKNKKNKFKETKILKLSSKKSRKKLFWKTILNSEKMIKLTADWYNYFYINRKGHFITSKQINNFFNL